MVWNTCRIHVIFAFGILQNICNIQTSILYQNMPLICVIFTPIFTCEHDRISELNITGRLLPTGNLKPKYAKSFQSSNGRKNTAKTKCFLNVQGKTPQKVLSGRCEVNFVEFNFVLKKLVFPVFIRRGTAFKTRKNPSKFALSFLFCQIYVSHMKTSSSLLSITSNQSRSHACLGVKSPKIWLQIVYYSFMRR